MNCPCRAIVLISGGIPPPLPGIRSRGGNHARHRVFLSLTRFGKIKVNVAHADTPEPTQALCWSRSLRYGVGVDLRWLRCAGYRPSPLNGPYKASEGLSGELCTGKAQRIRARLPRDKAVDCRPAREWASVLPQNILPDRVLQSSYKRPNRISDQAVTISKETEPPKEQATPPYNRRTVDTPTLAPF